MNLKIILLHIFYLKFEIHYFDFSNLTKQNCIINVDFEKNLISKTFHVKILYLILN
jgi:hypothetical protein